MERGRKENGNVRRRYGDGDQYTDPNNRSSRFEKDCPRLPDEDYFDWRLRLRKELKPIQVWERSPSPPKVIKKSAPTTLKALVRKGPSNPAKRKRSVSTSSDSSSSSSSSSESSSSSSSSSSSDSSTDRKKKKHRKNKSTKHSKSKSKKKGSKKTAGHAAPPAPNPPLDTNEIISSFELSEVNNFKEEVQGHRSSLRKEGDDDDEMGPEPMVQPMEYKDDRKVFTLPSLRLPLSISLFLSLMLLLDQLWRTIIAR
jgi:hypothetical protein